MLVIVIEDLGVCLNNSNLLAKKMSIWFGPSDQNGETDKQSISVFYANAKSLLHKSVCLSEENIGQNSSYVSKSDCHNPLETST